MTLLEQLRAMVSAVPAGGSVTIPRDWLAGELAGELAAAHPKLSSALESSGANGEPMLSAEDVARRLATSARWVYDHADELGGKRLSRRCLRFPEGAVRRYVERRR